MRSLMFPLRTLGTVLVATLMLSLLPRGADAQTAPGNRTGRVVYETTCIACHGPDGKAGVNLELEKVAKPPDFTNCAFAAREPDRGFLAVAHNGGPARGFSPLMAPWGGMYTEDELARAITHLRTFCKDDRWPRGELNLPRPMVTAKAFPEDEAVVAVTTQSSNVVTKIHYERRFGPLNQWEVILPVTTLDGANGRETGVGDVALEYKRVLTHSLARGNIASVTAEVKLPTGSESKGLGSGVAVFEPFMTFGQVLGRTSFVQAQAGFGIPMKSGHTNEVFWRGVLGTTVEQGRFGRNWSPMVEILAARELADGASIEWDVLPAAQVTLNTRQHVRLGVGVRLPVTDASERRKSAIVYLLWDWYEGGFFKGW